MDSISYCKFPAIAIAQAGQALLMARRIAILTHKSADPDTLGSAMALLSCLTAMERQTIIICPDQPPIEFRDLKPHFLVNQCPWQPDLVITVDCADRERAYQLSEYPQIPMINIDHHLSNPNFGTWNFVDGTAGSTCEVLTILIRCWFGEERITAEVATWLLYGLWADTQGLTTSSASVDTAAILSFLWRQGGDLPLVCKELKPQIKLHVAQGWAKLVSQATTTNDRYLIIRLPYEQTKELGLSLLDTQGLSSCLSNNLRDMQVIIFLYEFIPGEIKASIRSKGPNVIPLVQQWNGGGHPMAAGFTFNGKWEALLKELQERLNALS